MFRAYKQAQAACNIDNSKEETQTGIESDHSDDEFDNSMQSEVKKVWSEIEKQCQDKESNPTNVNTSSRSETAMESNTVHVFVSSTFTDFFNEREVLVKKVFPELKEWCQERGQKLIECDLRWGIPTDTSSSDTILVCLDEIEKCCEVNKGQPFFINLVGERYGWIPSVEETPDEAREKYGWIEGSSITFMEVLQGAYRDKNPNAAFFFRNRAVLDGIPESFHSRFQDKEPLARLHLKTMKKKIQERFPNQVFPYSCKFKQVSVSTGREQVELTDLDEFAEKVTSFLKGAIERTYPYSPHTETEKDLQSQEKDSQWLFALDKAKDLIGRVTELEILKDFVKTGMSLSMEQTAAADNGSNFVRVRENWELEESDNAICVLEGSSGWGKTALMCRLIVDTVKSGDYVFFHIVNSTPNSVHVESLLRQLVLVLNPEEDEKKTDDVESNSVEDLQKLLKLALARYRNSSDKKLVIFIDGLNELENNDIYDHLSWLPPTFPHNIHCVVSTNPHPPTTARLYEHPAFKMTLQPMTSEDLAAVAVKYLQAFSKKLDPDLLNSLICKTGVDNPLWMLMMTEELRIFGDFRALKDKIDKLPNNMEELLVQILDRLIQEDDENEVIKKVLCLTACSRHGLPSDSILKICGNAERKEELAPLYWARAHRQLKPYLRVFGRTEEVLTFSHEAVLKAVQSHLLTSWDEVTKWHTLLADYYQFWCDDPRTKAYHLPYHLESARLKQRLVDFLRKDPDSYTHINPWSRSSFAKKTRCHMMAQESMASTAAMMLCQRCSLSHRGYNPACTWQNKRCCVLCGSLCMGSTSIGARVCSRHSFKYGHKKCVLCTFIAGSSGVQAQLCRNCGFGSGDRTCACYDL
ncbi:unnamed protein product [Candidula unifasciata]|uniref:Uncharacterized protein n=1 Tax=Candidula unifasciata TaxID=100452 RepID=A0A8S4A6F3_9EUPU|nr:unnamed protein product [Candidula unifasciata]